MKMSKVVVVVLILFFSTFCCVWAANMSNTLTLERAKLALSTAGINPGKVFADGSNRYLVEEIVVRKKDLNTFTVDIKIKSLPLWVPSSP